MAWAAPKTGHRCRCDRISRLRRTWRGDSKSQVVRSGLGRLTLGRRIRGRKESVDPCLPQGRFASGDGSRLRAVEKETNRQADLAAHRDGEEMRDARGRLLEAK